jgi:hypothetical protein
MHRLLKNVIHFPDFPDIRIWLCAYTSCLMQVGEGGVDGVGGVFL